MKKITKRYKQDLSRKLKQAPYIPGLTRTWQRMHVVRFTNKGDWTKRTCWRWFIKESEIQEILATAFEEEITCQEG